ncbi:hypothetical protein BGZ60DRAFT_528637 [Tricladium varicosporioides]|nr:hypothetical protein BGZ60DRAFT_528637 [Hymenoscyphus varicosporioides]
MRTSVFVLYLSALLPFCSSSGVWAQTSNLASATAATKSVVTQSTTTSSSTTEKPSSAIWRYPLVENFTVDWVDTIMLQWDSNFANEAYLLMWCQLDGPGPAVNIGSQLRVLPSGVFPYILFSQNQNQKTFPVACHAQLAVTVYGQGFDDPVGITFTSQPNRKAQTFSMAVSSTTTSVSSSTTTQAGSSSVTSETGTLVRAGSTTRLNPTGLALPAELGKGELTAGGKAGMAIGIMVFCLVFIGSIIGVFWHTRRKQRRRDTEQAAGGKPRDGKGGFPPGWGRFELGDEGRRRYELGGTHVRQELDSKYGGYQMDTVVYELEGSTVPEKDNQMIMPREENKARKSGIGSARTARTEVAHGVVINSQPGATEMAPGMRNSGQRKTGMRRKEAPRDEGGADSLPAGSSRPGGNFI